MMNNTDDIMTKGGSVQDTALSIIDVSYNNPCLFDARKFQEDLAEIDLTEDQANELLQTLWDIMRTFVELGFGLDSTSILMAGNSSEVTDPELDVTQTDSAARDFNRAALQQQRKGE